MKIDEYDVNIKLNNIIKDLQNALDSVMAKYNNCFYITGKHIGVEVPTKTSSALTRDDYIFLGSLHVGYSPNNKLIFELEENASRVLISAATGNEHCIEGLNRFLNKNENR